MSDSDPNRPPQGLEQPSAARVLRSLIPNLVINDIMAITIRTFYPVSPDYMEINAWALAPIDESADDSALRLYNFLTFLGPGGFATPDDVEMLESCQRGFVNREVEWSDLSRGMKSEHRPPRHADAPRRHHAQHQRAGRQARPVDHHPFARGAHPLEQIEERADLSARTGEDAHLRASRRQGEAGQQRAENNGLDDRRSHHPCVRSIDPKQIINGGCRGKLLSHVRAGGAGLPHPRAPRCVCDRSAVADPDDRLERGWRVVAVNRRSNDA